MNREKDKMPACTNNIDSCAAKLRTAISCVSPRLLLAGVAFLLGMPAQAAPCPSPDLAPAYSDCNGDRVADPPEDKSQWLDPDPIVLADVPTTDMTARAVQAEPFIRYLEKALGRKVVVFMASDYADLVAGFKANRAHLVAFNTGNVERAVRCDGYVPLAQPVDAKGNIDGYRMQLLVPSKSKIKTVPELRGHKITFVDEISNSGYTAPRGLLAKEFGLIANKDYSFNFSGRQDNSILGVANGLYEAAAVASDIHEKLVRELMIDGGSVRVIYSSQIFSRSPWGVSHRLKPALAKHLQEAIVRYDGPKVLQSGSRFKVANYLQDWAFMREMSAAAGAAPTCK